jgi:hypothetical protein
MSEQSFLTDEDEVEERTVSLKRSQIRSLEQRAKEADGLKERLAAMERKSALLESGIDLNGPTGKLFAKHYDGDVSVEAIRAAASEYGLAPAAGNEHAAELQAAKRVADAAAGGGGDREIDVQDAWREAIAAGKGQDEILRIARAAGMHIVGDND